MELAAAFDLTALKVKTTGEPVVDFGNGYLQGYGDCLSDVCDKFPGIDLRLAQVIKGLHAYTRSVAIRARSIKAYRAAI